MTAGAYPAGTVYESFQGVAFNSADQVLFGGSVKYSGGGSDVVLSLLQTADSGNQVVSEQVVVKTGDLLPGLASPVSVILTREGSFDLNEAGSVVYVVRAGAEGAIYIDDTQIAKEGEPSPIAGRDYLSFFAQAGVADINDHGHHAFRARITGPLNTDIIVVRNGEVVAQQGRFAPNGTTINNLPGPLRINQLGEVLWLADWLPVPQVPTITRTALYLEDQLLLQEGSSIGSDFVDKISTRTEHIAMSPNGRYVLCQVSLAIQGEAVVLFDLGEVAPLNSCIGNTGYIERASGFATINTSLQVVLQDVLTPTTQSFGLWVSPTSLPCGVIVQGHELLVDVTNPGAYSLAGGATAFAVPIPNDPALRGAKFYLQGLALDFSQPVGQRVTLTEGLAVTIAE